MPRYGQLSRRRGADLTDYLLDILGSAPSGVDLSALVNAVNALLGGPSATLRPGAHAAAPRPRAADLQACESVLSTLMSDFSENNMASLLAYDGGAAAIALLRLIAAARGQVPDTSDQSSGAGARARTGAGAARRAASNGDTRPEPGCLPRHLDPDRVFSLAFSVTNAILVKHPRPSPPLTVFARKLLRMQSLHACSRVLAAWCTACQGAASARARAASGGRGVGAPGALVRALNLVQGMGFYCRTSEPGAACLRELAEALRASNVMEHAGRLLMRLMQLRGTARDAQLEALYECMHHFLAAYDTCASGLLGTSVCGVGSGAAMLGAADVEAPAAAADPAARELGQAVSGPCADHTVMVLGLKALCALDGGSAHGLPAEVLDCVPSLTDARVVKGPPGTSGQLISVATRSLALACLASAKARRLSGHAAMAVLLRLARLGLASAQAGDEMMAFITARLSEVFYQSIAGGTARDEQQGIAGAAARASRILPETAVQLAVLSLAAAREVMPPQQQQHSGAVRWAGELAEWWRLLVAVCRAREGTLLLKMVDRPELLRLGRLMEPLMQRPPGCICMTPQPTPEQSAALAAGVLPCLERLLRRACVDPSGPEQTILGGLSHRLLSGLSWGFLAPLLLHGDPGQAAAFVVTLGKLLRQLAGGDGAGDSTRREERGQPRQLLLVALVLATNGLQGGIFALMTGEGPLQTQPAAAAAPPPQAAEGAPGPSAAAEAAAEAAAAPQDRPGLGASSILAFMIAEWLPPLSLVLQRQSKLGSLVASSLPATLDVMLASVGCLLSAALDWAGRGRELASAGLGAPNAASGHAASGGATENWDWEPDWDQNVKLPSAGASGHGASFGGGGGGLVRPGSDPRVWARAVLGQVDLVAMLDSAVELLEATGISVTDPAASVATVGGLVNAYLAVAAAFPEVARAVLVDRAAGHHGGDGGGARARGGGGSADVLAAFWPPRGLKPILHRLGRDAPQQEAAMLSGLEEVLASVERWSAWCRVLQTDNPWLRELRLMSKTSLKKTLVPASRLADPGAVRALLRRCGNSGCTGVKGDTEMELRLQACGRCGGVSYCCRECQEAHWRAGHKAECRPKSSGK